jgi:serine protease AprX
MSLTSARSVSARCALVSVLIGAGLWTSAVTPAVAGSRERAIVRFERDVAPAERARIVREAGGRVVRDLHLIDGLGVEIGREPARRLARHPGVRAVNADAAIRPAGKPGGDRKCGDRWAAWCPGALATAYVQSTRTDKAWTDDEHPATGAGVGVAVIDTGIAGDLPDFAAADGSSRVIATAVTNPEATTATDRYGHGTHVAGLVAGNGRRLPSADPLYNRYIGTAPDAHLVSIKASDDEGNSTVIDVIDGLQFAVDHKDEYGIRVVNLSLTSTEAQSYRTDPLDAAAEAAWFAGIVVVAAAGNRGRADDAVSYAPANDPFVITVGGVDDQGSKATHDDALAPWSSQGITQDGFAKPDLVAPAAHIVGPLAPDSIFERLCADCIVDGRYFRVGGTSMASPIVAGIAADLLQIHAHWTPDQVKQALVTSTRPALDGANEVAADLALHARPTAATLGGLDPSLWIDPATGTLDYARAPWRRASWSEAVDALRASWSRASWRCADCGGGAATDDTRASWRRASWRRASWSSFLGDSPDQFGSLSGGMSGAAADGAAASHTAAD